MMQASSVTFPSRRPSVKAKPELVVASALKPRASSTRADPASQGCPNRPSPEELGDALSAWTAVQPDPSTVFVGGPVEPDALIAIARMRESAGGTTDPEHLAPLSGYLASADQSSGV